MWDLIKTRLISIGCIHSEDYLVRFKHNNLYYYFLNQVIQWSGYKFEFLYNEKKNQFCFSYSVSCSKDVANVHVNTCSASDLRVPHTSVYFLKGLLKTSHLHMTKLIPKLLSDFFPPKIAMSLIGWDLGPAKSSRFFLFFFI